jgi:hypothetical protein
MLVTSQLDILTYVIEDLTTDVKALIAQINERVSSSFQSTPVGMKQSVVERQAKNRPGLYRRERNSHTEEWKKIIRTRHEYTGYSLVYSQSEFKLFYSIQNKTSLRLICASDHRDFKNLFLVFGLCNYNCETSCNFYLRMITLGLSSHVKENGHRRIFRDMKTNIEIIT